MIETRQIAHGSIVEIHDLQLEIMDQADALGAACEGVTLRSKDPDPGTDTLEITFTDQPDPDPLDAAIASYVEWPEPDSEAEIVEAGAWVTIWDRLVPDGSAVSIDAECTATRGAGPVAAAARAGTRGVSRRRPGEALGGVGSSPITDPAAEIAGLELRVAPAGNRLQLQVRADDTGTIRLAWSTAACRCTEL